MNTTTKRLNAIAVVAHALSAIASLAAVAVLFFSPAVMVARAAPQDSSQSVAEAARKARARKKSPKPVKTIDDDTLRKGDTHPPVGESAGAATEPAAESVKPPADKSGDAEAAAKQAAELKSKIAAEEAELKSAKAQLVNAQKDAELAQRNFDLEREQFYSKTDASRDTTGKARLDGLQAQITDRQQNVERLKAKIVVLEDLLKQHKAAAGVK